ncbi:MAG: class I SAM-dependent methyltransferase [Deltaproteobacteria bacterium]|nr:class I SAM-dependent methyltransferase [Deltaproteobacteria bacterium]
MREDEERTKAREWCRSCALSTEQVARELGLSGSVGSVAQMYPDVWSRAEEAERACPIKMGGAAHVDLLYFLVRELRAARVVESGVAAGWSSLALLLGLQATSGQLISVDMPYAKLDNEPYVGVAVSAELRARWTLIRLPDRDGLPRAIRALGTVDLAHHDSDKSYPGRQFAYAQMWKALRPGGALVSDDIEDNFGFRDFAADLGLRALVTPKAREGSFVGVIRKPS